MTATEGVSLRDALSAHFLPTDVEWRLGTAGKKDDGSIWAKAFAYITNRAIQERLDDVVGPGQWKNEYRPWEIGTPGVLCGLSLKIDGEWVTKWDGAEQTDMEAMKGGLSNAMKRAAVQWGVGRYLYDLPEGWAKVSPTGAHYASQVKIKVKGQEERVTFKWDPPDLPTWALPENQAAASGNGIRQAVREAIGPRGSVDDGNTESAVEALERSPAVAAALRTPPSASVPTPRPQSADAPSLKQTSFFERLMHSSVFTDEERQIALTWLAQKATRESIKAQIDWAKRTITARDSAAAGA